MEGRELGKRLAWLGSSLLAIALIFNGWFRLTSERRWATRFGLLAGHTCPTSDNDMYQPDDCDFVGYAGHLRGPDTRGFAIVTFASGVAALLAMITLGIARRPRRWMTRSAASFAVVGMLAACVFVDVAPSGLPAGSQLHLGYGLPVYLTGMALLFIAAGLLRPPVFPPGAGPVTGWGPTPDPSAVAGPPA